MLRSTRRFGNFSLDLAEHQLLRDGQPVPLTPEMFDLLRVLVENAGHLVEKDRLLKEVWADAFVEESNLNRGISVLRKALGETAAERYIETVPKRGYRFVAAVRTDPSAPVVPVGHAGDQPDEPALGGERARKTYYCSLGRRGAYDCRGVRRAGHAWARGRAVGDSSLHRQLTFTGKDTAPALSPDGTRIAYVSRESPRRKVIVQEVDGGRTSIFSARRRPAPCGGHPTAPNSCSGLVGTITRAVHLHRPPAEARARLPLASLSRAGHRMGPRSPSGCLAQEIVFVNKQERHSGKSRFREPVIGCGTWTGRRLTDGCCRRRR